MTASIDYGIQASYNFKSLMVNVRGRDAEEFEHNLNAVRELALTIDEVGEALAANANKPLTEEQRQETERLIREDLGGQTISRSCTHGDMNWKEGTGKASGKPFKGWFCPRNICSPIFER